MTTEEYAIVKEESGRRFHFRRKWLWGYLCIAPYMIKFLVLILGPFLASLYLSLSRWRMAGPIKYMGLANYERMFMRDDRFVRTLLNTTYYTVFHLPVALVIAFILALLLNQQLRFNAVFRTVFYIPSVVSGVATAMLWRWIFTGDGLLNWFLSLFGIDGPIWLMDPDWAMPALILRSYWSVGGTMVIYLAGLQGIPEHLYEAARVDGAGIWHKFWHITVPMMTPTIFLTLLMGVIRSFQVFTTAFVMTAGGPGDATLFYLLYLYYKAFEDMAMGYASALAWVLFVIIMILTAVQMRLAKRWVYYEGAR